MTHDMSLLLKNRVKGFCRSNSIICSILATEFLFETDSGELIFMTPGYRKNIGREVFVISGDFKDRRKSKVFDFTLKPDCLFYLIAYFGNPVFRLNKYMWAVFRTESGKNHQVIDIIILREKRMGFIFHDFRGNIESFIE